jgi:hypothetical protein
MALTPEKVAEFDKILGVTGATPTATPAKSRADEIRSLAVAATPAPTKPLKEKLGDIATGGVKGAIEGTVETAKALQGLGQRFTALIDPTKTLEEVRASTGFESLKGEVASHIHDTLKASNNYEKAGKIAEFMLELAWPVGKTAEAEKLIQKGKEVAAPIIEKGKAIVDPILEKGKREITDLIAKRSARIATEDAAKVDKLAGTIVQGKPEDIVRAKKVLAEINPDDIKTYDDLVGVLNDKVKGISTKFKEVLATEPYVKPLEELTAKNQVGTDLVEHNYVKDALEQLTNFYTKTNDQTELAKLTQLRAKAAKEGLTINEIDDLAIKHGQDLNGFNANGELASGLSKQAAENTRKGLKETARQQFNSPLYKETDEVRSNLIKVRDLSKDVAEEVNKLKQKTTERGFGEKVGRLVFQIADKITGGGLKGFIQSFIPRSQGLKIMNALDLEKGLQKNLKKLQELNGKGLTEEQLIKKLEEMLQP